MSYFDEIISPEDREEIRQGAFRFNNTLINGEFMIRMFVLIGLYGHNQIDRTTSLWTKKGNRR